MLNASVAWQSVGRRLPQLLPAALCFAPPSANHSFFLKGVLCVLLTDLLHTQNLGWPAVFYIFGSFGLVWNLAWQKLVADYPPLLPAASQSKAQLAESAAVQQQQAALVQQQQGVVQQQLPQQLSQQPQLAAGRLPPLPRVRDLPWREFFTNKAFLAIVMAHSAFGEQQGAGVTVTVSGWLGWVDPGSSMLQNR